MRSKLGFGLVSLTLIACDPIGFNSGSSLVASPPRATPTLPTAEPAAATPTVDRKALEERLAAACEKARAASADAGGEAPAVHNAIVQCWGERQDCEAKAGVLDMKSHVGWLSGHACHVRFPSIGADEGTRRDVEQAEGWAAQAEALGKVEGEQRRAKEAAVAAEKAQIKDEAAKIKTAAAACGEKEAPCKAACAKDDKYACIAWAIVVWHETKPPKFDDALAMMNAKCNERVLVACKLAPQVEQEAANYKRDTESAWNEAKIAGDTIATKRYQAAWARAHFSGTKNMQAVQRMETHIALITKDEFCPQKKEFILRTSAKEFATRAAAHCKTEAPTTSNDTGAVVTLTNECTAAFATGCY
jgi:hypothetical protein